MVSKRLLFARTLSWTGITRLLMEVPSRPGLLVLNHHRIADASDCQFDRGVIGASAEEFQCQLAFLKRWFPIIGLAEAIDLLRYPKRIRRMHVLLTFDD